MKIEIAKFQDGYYYVVDGVKQHLVQEQIADKLPEFEQDLPKTVYGIPVVIDPKLPKNTMQLRTQSGAFATTRLDV